jgi:hypothetical protein
VNKVLGNFRIGTYMPNIPFWVVKYIRIVWLVRLDSYQAYRIDQQGLFRWAALAAAHPLKLKLAVNFG